MPSNQLIHKITVGCDPEIFLEDKKTGQIVSAHGLIPGTKAKPYKTSVGAVQVDGVAAEFNIDPAPNNHQFAAYVAQTMTDLQKMLPDHRFVIQPVNVFNEEYWKTLPEETKQLGCDPDYNAWTGQVNPSPNPGKTMRTAAGHIHIGWTKIKNPMDEGHFEDCRIVAQQLDYCLGVYTLLWDTDSRRRELYGKAGAFRPKPYGIEYRTPSNAWLRHPMLYGQIFNMAYQTVYGLISGRDPIFTDKYGEKARQVIDNNDYEFVRGGSLKKTWHQDMMFDWPGWN